MNIAPTDYTSTAFCRALPGPAPGSALPGPSCQSSWIPRKGCGLASLVFHSSIRGLLVACQVPAQVYGIWTCVFSGIIRDNALVSRALLQAFTYSRILHGLCLSSLKACLLTSSKSPVTAEPFLTGLFIPCAKDMLTSLVLLTFVSQQEETNSSVILVRLILRKASLWCSLQNRC